MTDIWFAGALAALSRFIRLRKKRKNPDGERIEVLLPEWSKFLIYWGLMFIWVKFVNWVFWIIFNIS